MSTDSRSLYERMGGELSVALLVDRFYDRVMKDPELAAHFEQVPMERLRSMQVEFFSAALGGPSHYSGKNLRRAHTGKGISQVLVDRFLRHLMATIQFMHPTPEETREIYERLAELSGDVVEEEGEG